MEFSRMYDPPVIVVDDSDYPTTMEQFNEIVLPDGSVKRSKADPLPLYDLIQSYESECNLANIFARYQSGDFSVAQKSGGVYLDLSKMPDDPDLMADYFSELGKMLKDQKAASAEISPTVSENNSENDKKAGEDNGDE